MRLSAPAIASAVLLASALAAVVQSRAQNLGLSASFSSNVQVVNVLATVRDKKANFIRNLGKNDFVLLEDGRPQKIQYFSAETDLPLTIGLMVDTSLSQTKVLNDERGASFHFIDDVLRENKDQVFIMQFDMNVRTRQALTGSRADLQESLRLLNTPTKAELRSQYGGGTLLYDAISDAAKEVMKNRQGRKALIVLSDGDDHGSNATLTDAVQEAQRTNTLVYTILFTDGSGGARGKKVMLSLAQATGGTYFVVTSKLSIDDVFRQIEEDLRSQYSIGYASDKPAVISEFRRLQLSTSRPELAVNARDRYWAGPEATR